MDKLLPWPARRHRKAAIIRARASRARAEAARDQADRLGAEIRRMTADNHFAAAIAAQLALRQGKEGT